MSSPRQKPVLSIDISAAENHRELEGQLPASSDHDEHQKSEKENTIMQVKKGQEVVGNAAAAVPPQEPEHEVRDMLTGRLISSNRARSCCLRCQQKLRCTLSIRGGHEAAGDVLQCSACRRNGEKYCLRLSDHGGADARELDGPPWKNPNYITGTTEFVGRRELEEILEPFFLGEKVYVAGECVYEVQRDAWALPAAAAAEEEGEEQDDDNDLDIGDRWRGLGRGVGWRAVLPVRENRSLMGIARNEEENARDEEGGIQESSVYGQLSLNAQRKYEPRLAHLKDVIKEAAEGDGEANAGEGVLGETW
ncbi:hypothetical protein F4778DRAFT_556893 [Xylariomycetidae sp. FL2044]|nr:hypothetical protein F4778DRAFT_556893 [Xylariomycetidae sp. FL2044]